MRRILTMLGLAAASASAAWATGAPSELKKTESYVFDVKPGARVELRNISGDIHVERWDESRVTVEVEKLGEGETEEEINKAFEVWTVVAEGSPERVLVEAKLAERTKGRRWSLFGADEASVLYNFKARVPRGADVDVSSVNGESIDLLGLGDGDSNAQNVNGDIRYEGSSKRVLLTTVNGSVTAQLDSLPADGDVRLKTVNGELIAFLPAGAGAEVHVQSLGGAFYSNLELPKRVVESFIGFKYAEKLGAGGARLRMDSVHGSIRLLRSGSDAGAGEELVDRRPGNLVIAGDFDIDPEISEIGREAREAAQEAAREAREAMREAREAVREAAQEAQEAAREAREAALEEAREVRESVQGHAQEIRERAREAAQAAREQAREGAENAREAARKARDSVRAALNGHRHKHSEGTHLDGIIGGDLNIRDSNEDIAIGQVEGNASLVTYAGDIAIASIGGEGKLLTYGGDIAVSRSGKSLEAETYGGDVSVGSAEGPLVVRTKGGDINVGSAAAGVTAETLGGDIELRGIRGAVKADTKGGEITAVLKELPAAGGEVSITSMGGDLDVALPRGQGANVRVEILVSRRSAGETLLQTSLKGLEKTVQDQDGEVLVVYSGAVNGGGPKVTLRTTHGEVVLRQAN